MFTTASIVPATLLLSLALSATQAIHSSKSRFFLAEGQNAPTDESVDRSSTYRGSGR